MIRDEVAVLVDMAIMRLEKKAFAKDPIVNDRFARIHSVIGSAYKRHGIILQAALKSALSEYMEVWSEPSFRVSEAAERLADVDDVAAINTSLPYGSGKLRQIDLIAFNRKQGFIGAYEVKRGNGLHDAGKTRSMLRDIKVTQMLLHSYGESVKPGVIRCASARFISYYGKSTVDKPWLLTKDDLDSHFDAPIIDKIELVNKLFTLHLQDLLNKLFPNV